MQPESEEQFKQYLRQFEPLPPGPLPELGTHSGWSPGAVGAIAAMIVAAVGLLLWHSGAARQGSHPQLPRASRITQLDSIYDRSSVSLGRSNRLMLDSPSQLDDHLAALSRGLLPNVERPGSTLGALAKE